MYKPPRYPIDHELRRPDRPRRRPRWFPTLRSVFARRWLAAAGDASIGSDRQSSVGVAERHRGAIDAKAPKRTRRILMQEIPDSERSLYGA
jgi:hypothetical protein